MAHTDRHRPVWVQANDPHERDFSWCQDGHSEHQKAFFYRLCSCRWHSAYWTRKAEHATRRRVEREAIRRALTGDRDAFDGRRRV